MSSADAFWAAVDVLGAADDVVAMGDDLRPETVYAAYRHGVFPWPADGWPAVPWCSPDPRAVLVPAAVRVSRSLRSTLRRSGWLTTVDAAFEAVIDGCADRPSTWISAGMRAAYVALHAMGVAHSVEVWSREGKLIGGLYGVRTGAVFSGESMFFREPDASKVALVDLVRRFAAAGGVLVDCQQPTAHLASLGAGVVGRADYLRLLYDVRNRPGRLATDPRPVSRLAASSLGSEPGAGVGRR